MLQCHAIVTVFCLINIQCLLLEGWSGNTYSMHSFKARHISHVHQFKRNNNNFYICKSFQRYRFCRYIASGINESLFNISIIDDESNNDDEATARSIDMINADIATLTNEKQPNKNNTIRGITLKMAFDVSGGVACRSETRPERFTCSESLDMVHRLRSNSDAVLIGVGTAMVDNPSLLVRRNITVTKQPLRVIIDPTLRFITSPSSSRSSQHNNSYQLLTDGYPVAIFHCRHDTTTNPMLYNIIKDLPLTVQLHYLDPINGKIGRAHV